MIRFKPFESRFSEQGWHPLLSLEFDELSDLVSIGVCVIIEGEAVRGGGSGVWVMMEGEGVWRGVAGLGGSTGKIHGDTELGGMVSGEVRGEAGKGAAASILLL